MRAHWLSTFALIGVAAFAGGALSWQAAEALDPAWLAVAVAVGAGVALLARQLASCRRRR